MKVFLSLIFTLILITGCRSEHAEHAADEAGHTDHSDHAEHGSAKTEFERGPKNGRLLREGDFALEVTIFETGVPPEYRLFAYQKNSPLAPESVTATIVLKRLDGEVNRFEFKPLGSSLVGNGVVTEPHSFDVEVTAQHAGKTYRWAYDSYDGRTTIPDATAQAAGLKLAKAGPAAIHDRLPLLGQVMINADRLAQVRARFVGSVREVRVAAGDAVKAGQTLAIVENRESLRTFAVSSPINGTVLARHTNVGDVAGDAALFEIADFSSVWVEFSAVGATAERLAAGQTLRIRSTSGEIAAESRIERLLPIARSQALVARARLDNVDGRWRPGMTVDGEVTLAVRNVGLAVERIGLQRFRDFTVVFAKVGETYEVRMLELGAQDDTFVEVVGGLKLGTEYVTEQSFLIKADIEKSGASHDH
jgi:membrane fusion protein, heavy metal efflux system